MISFYRVLRILSRGGEMGLIMGLEELLWSGPLLVMLLGSHVYFTWKLRFVQRHTFLGIRLSLRGGRGKNGVSSFGALATSLAAAIGTGNIIGVASAVALGGPGAVLWCWLTGVLGMATRYAEAYLSLRFRERKPDGSFSGGPMYVMERVLGKPKLGRSFALLGVVAAVGTGALIQTNAVGVALEKAWDVPRLMAAIGVTGLAALVILGGVGSISRVCEKMVPLMSGLYVLGCLWLLLWNADVLPETLRLIVTSAFTPRAAGGGFVGSTLRSAARYGSARGLFTNESGMGTAPMAAVTAPAEDPRQEALVSMTGVFWDTVVICAMTGLALVSAMVKEPALFQGAAAEELCYLAFSQIPGGGWILTVCLAVFAFATVVGWSWYGVCCSRYLWGGERVYHLCYLAAAFCGFFVEAEAVWSLGGILAGLMAVPNIISLFFLRETVAESVKTGSNRLLFPQNSL